MFVKGVSCLTKNCFKNGRILKGLPEIKLNESVLKSYEKVPKSSQANATAFVEMVNKSLEKMNKKPSIMVRLKRVPYVLKNIARKILNI